MRLAKKYGPPHSKNKAENFAIARRTARRRSSTAPLVTDAGRRGRRPLRSSVGEWCVGVGLLDDPNRAYTAPLVKTLSLRGRKAPVAIRSPAPTHLFPHPPKKEVAGWPPLRLSKNPPGFSDKRLAVCCAHNFYAMRKNSTLAA